MRIWIVCWANKNGTPDMDVFTDIDGAMQCLRYMAGNGISAIIKTITVEQKAEEKDNVVEMRPAENAEEGETEQ